MTSEVVAVEGDVAVVRAQVEYADRSRWRDLWVLRFAADGRCVPSRSGRSRRISRTATDRG